MRELGVGIAGYGFIGNVHAFAHQAIPFLYAPLPFRTRLAGVCTATPESGQKAREQAGFDFATTDPNELLARPDIDIVHVCTPNDAHFDFLKAALAAGKHIYCDKPLTRTAAEAEEIAALAKASPNSVCRMTFNCRFIPAVLRAKELIDSGFLGEIYQFRGAYLHAGYLDPKRPRTWRLEMARSGGGAIMDLGAHVIDLMRWLIGDFTSVQATLETRIPVRPDPRTGEPKPVDVDDIAVVQVRAACGAIGVLEASRLAAGVQDELRFEIHGSRGALSFNLMDPNWLTVYDATVSEGPLGGSRGPQRLECVNRYPKPYAFGAAKNTIGWPQFHVHCLHDFLMAVAGSPSQAGATFDDGLAVHRFIDACHRSTSSGAWTSI